ncbi:MAG: glycosyltransferase family 39 protein [SAR324 cluster bacterium]|nr:glycosyltransferase family 39 protein [SAR324 cluster bacterium]
MRNHAIAIAILSGHLVVLLFLDLFINPHPDMLDHWVWSRHLSLSYYEHPPMVALAIRLFTSMIGNSEFALELAAQAYNISILALSYAICYSFFGKRAAIFCLILLESIPYYLLGSVFLHIDQPFLIFWLLNLYFLCRFHQTNSNKWLILLGITAGLGALSKYITILFYIGLFLHLLSYKELRHHLKNPWLYLAGCISLLIFTPVLLWNYQNDWVSFRFQFKRGLSGSPLGQNFIFFTLGHLFLFSLVWSWWGLYQLWNKRKAFVMGAQPEAVVLFISIFPLFFFSAMSLRGSIADPHWANVAYLGIMMLSGRVLGSMWDANQRSFIKKMVGGGAFLNIAILIVAFIYIQHPFVEIPQYQLRYYSAFEKQGVPEEVIGKLRTLKRIPPLRKEEFLQRVAALLSAEELQKYKTVILKIARDPNFDPVNPAIGWEQSTAELLALLEESKLNPIDYIISKEFQLSSAFSFYLPNQPWPYSLEKPERNQWSSMEDVRNHTSILVCKPHSCSRVLRRAKKRFERDFSYLGEITTNGNGRLIRQLEVYHLNPN